MQFFRSQRTRNVIQLSQARQQSILKEMLRKMKHFLKMLFTKQPELQVRLQRDPNGQTWWVTHNLMTGEIQRFWSYFEMLAWIQDRYLKE
jgi:hypothetical protein